MVLYRGPKHSRERCRPCADKVRGLFFNHAKSTCDKCGLETGISAISRHTKNCNIDWKTNLTNSQIGWIVGLIESEGCITIKEYNNNYEASLIVHMTDRLPLELLQKYISAGYIGSERKRKDKNAKSCYEFELKYLPALRHLLYIIIPNMRIKREQAIILLLCLKTSNSNRKVLKDAIRALNWRGRTIPPTKYTEAFQIVVQFDEYKKLERDLSMFSSGAYNSEDFLSGWIASFIDGDGCFSTDGTNSIIKVNNTQPIATTRMFDAYNGWSLSIKDMSGTNSKDSIELTMAKKDDVRKFLYRILPFLLIKRAQAIILILHCDKDCDTLTLEREQAIRALNWRGVSKIPDTLLKSLFVVRNSNGFKRLANTEGIL